MEWLLQADPWTRYNTLRELLRVPETSRELKDAKNALLRSEAVQELISDAAKWFPYLPKRHNDPKLSHYALRMLVDFGMTYDDLSAQDIVSKATAHMDGNLLAIRQERPERPKKGNAEEEQHAGNNWIALPCDSPLITYTLLKLGYDAPLVGENVKFIKEQWSTTRGWFCHLFFVEGIYKKLQVGCPMAGLQALEVFSTIPELKESQYARNAFYPLQYHRDSRKSLYYFGRSKKFWTLKYPFVWYNALYLAEVLSRFDFLRADPLMIELVEWLESSQDELGRYRPTSMYMPFKHWDFGNKKEASPWITFLVYRILNRFSG